MYIYIYIVNMWRAINNDLRRGCGPPARRPPRSAARATLVVMSATCPVLSCLFDVLVRLSCLSHVRVMSSLVYFMSSSCLYYVRVSCLFHVLAYLFYLLISIIISTSYHNY